jgi:hypothetical protein
MSEPQRHDKLLELHLLNPHTMTFADLMAMFRRLTGREPTAEEVEEAKREWESDEGENKDEAAGRGHSDPRDAAGPQADGP